jgi:hypothetical protein
VAVGWVRSVGAYRRTPDSSTPASPGRTPLPLLGSSTPPAILPIERPSRPRRAAIQPGRCPMDLIQGLLGAVVTIVALVLIIGLLAALFMIVFGIATGIDDTIQS